MVLQIWTVADFGVHVGLPFVIASHSLKPCWLKSQIILFQIFLFKSSCVQSSNCKTDGAMLQNKCPLISWTMTGLSLDAI